MDDNTCDKFDRYWNHHDRFGELGRIGSSPNIRSPNLLKKNAKNILDDPACTFKPKINTMFHKVDKTKDIDPNEPNVVVTNKTIVRENVGRLHDPE